MGMGIHHDSEVGWAKCFGEHNIAGVVIANGAVNFGVDWLGGRIYRKGGRWRYVAVALTAGRAVEVAGAGFHNIGQLRRH